MKAFIPLVAILCITVFAHISIAQTTQPKAIAYIEKYKNIAMAEMARTGVPAAITLAQGILESGYGQSKLAQGSNNHFGIKCKTEWTGDKSYHDDDAKGECFRVYKNAEESYIDHSDFLKNRPYYTELFKLPVTDYKAWAYGLKKAGYATEKNYPQMLISLVERYQLTQYDEEMLANKDLYLYLANNRRATQADYDRITAAKNAPAVVAEDNKTASVQEPALVTEKTIRTPYPEGFFRINGTKVFYAPAGLSLVNFCKSRNLSYHKVLAYNNMHKTVVLQQPQLIYIEKRKKKGRISVFKTNKGNTLRQIALQEGVRLEMLQKYNRLQPDTKIAANQKVYLQKKAPSKIIVLN